MLHMISLALLLGLVDSIHAQRVDKPPLWDNGLPLSDYPNGLHAVAATWKPVGAPDMCVESARGMLGCPVDTLEAREVTYADCDVPWILCRCANAIMSMDTITSRFGFVPAGIRSYVGGLIVSPQPIASAGTSGDFIVFNGECVVPVFIHEAAHSLDAGTSPTPAWINAVNRSTCVPDDYAQSSQAENFAQVTVVYSYLTKHGSVPGDTTCLKPQLDFMMHDARISQAQNTERCIQLRRPFILQASNRHPLGTAGSSGSSSASPSSTSTSTAGSSTTSSSGTVTLSSPVLPSATRPLFPPSTEPGQNTDPGQGDGSDSAVTIERPSLAAVITIAVLVFLSKSLL